jgi:hypothetical protein
MHSAVLTFNADCAVFPPNTLFRLREVHKEGSWQGPGGVCPQQRLLVVSATYHQARAHQGEDAEGKLCGNVATLLSYASRTAYVKGLDDILLHPVLSMAQEFDRELEWRDWKGMGYTLRSEWKYVSGIAKPLAGCTPGTRDAQNGGKTVNDFMSEANKFIKQRRDSHVETCTLPEEYAFLTESEVIAIRLYSGPAYQPINGFLRAIGCITGAFRTALATHPALTFAATVSHVCSGIRKLAAVATMSEMAEPLWRGVRGELPKSFWVADSQGIICATDLAFMSTSRHRQTPIRYMSDSAANVLWELQPAAQSDVAYHQGADISTLSMFAGEKEVLFPPCTMLVAKQITPQYTIQEEGKSFVPIAATPCFV